MSKFIKEIKQYLCPPGNGVYTVHTAKEHKDLLHEKLYQTTEPQAVQSAWERSLEKLHSNQLPVIFGITMDTGGGIQRGANWGPLFIRSKILEKMSTGFFDLGDTRTIPQLIHDKYLNKETIENCQKALYGETSDLPVSALSIAERMCAQFFEEVKAPLLTLGGDHSVSYPVVKAWLEHKKKHNIRCAIVHFDAHTDLMDERLGIDLCFATWAKKVMPFMHKKSDLLQLGIRSSGQNKDYWQKNTGVQQFWTEDIKREGIGSITDQVIKYLNEEEIQEVYLSFDIDALDSKYASSTGTPEEEGLEPHECISIINAISRVTKISAADLVEVAPFVASSKKNVMSPEPETTLLSSSLLVRNFLDVLSSGR